MYFSPSHCDLKRLCCAGIAALFLTGGWMGLSHSAGIPVIDVTNLQQTVVSATENVAQTLKQIEQYRTQLQQYENMLQNTAAPTA